MFAILKKELEQRYWLILINLASFGLIYYLTYYYREPWVNYSEVFNSIPAKHHNFIMGVYPNLMNHQLVSMLLGAITGFVIFVGEMNLKQWFFLKHRAIQGWRIVLSKMFTGSIFYGFPASLFFLGQIYWFAAPGKIGTPWVWSCLLLALYPVIWGWTTMFCFSMAAYPGLKLWQRFITPLALLAVFMNVAFVDMNTKSLTMGWYFLLSGMLPFIFFSIHVLAQEIYSGIKVTWRLSIVLSVMLMTQLGSSFLLMGLDHEIIKSWEPPYYSVFGGGIFPFLTRDGHIAVYSKQKDDYVVETPFFRGEIEYSKDDIFPFSQMVPLVVNMNFKLFSFSPMGGVIFNEVQELYYSGSEKVDTRYFWLKGRNIIVGYSTATRRKAGYLGLNGWVRDESDVVPFDEIKDIVHPGMYLKMDHPVYWITTGKQTYLWQTASKRLVAFPDFRARVFGVKKDTHYAMDSKQLLKFNIRTGDKRFIAIPEGLLSTSLIRICEFKDKMGFMCIPFTNSEHEKVEKAGWFMAVVKWNGEVSEQGYVQIPIPHDDMQRQSFTRWGRALCLLPGWEWYSFQRLPPFMGNGMYDHITRAPVSFWKRNAPFLSLILLKNALLTLFVLVFLVFAKRISWQKFVNIIPIILLGTPWLIALILTRENQKTDTPKIKENLFSG